MITSAGLSNHILVLVVNQVTYNFRITINYHKQKILRCFSRSLREKYMADNVNRIEFQLHRIK